MTGGLARLVTIVVLCALAALLPAAAPAAAPKPDFVPTSLTSSKERGYGGESFRVGDVVRNKGGASKRASKVAFYLSFDERKTPDDMLLGSRTLPRLKAGKGSHASTSLRFPDNATGLFYLIACADADGKVRERNERNNCRTAPNQLQIDKAPAKPKTARSLLSDRASCPATGTTVVRSNQARQHDAHGAAQLAP